jgi:hypothetical protein
VMAEGAWRVKESGEDSESDEQIICNMSIDRCEGQ